MESKLLEKLIKDKTDFCVKVSNEYEANKLLSLFDSYEGIEWVDGHSPMEFKNYNYPYYIYLRDGKTITYYWKKTIMLKKLNLMIYLIITITNKKFILHVKIKKFMLFLKKMAK